MSDPIKDPEPYDWRAIALTLLVVCIVEACVIAYRAGREQLCKEELRNTFYGIYGEGLNNLSPDTVNHWTPPAEPLKKDGEWPGFFFGLGKDDR